MTKNTKNKSLINKLLWLGTCLTAASVLCSFTAVFIDPRTWALPQFLGLLFPYAYVLNLLFFVYWLSGLNIRLLLPLIIIICSFWATSKYLQFNTNKTSNKEKTIHVGSLNSQLFGHWQGREFIDTALLSVRNLNLDILCLQEAYITGKNKDSLLNNVLVNTLFNDYKYSKLVEAKPFGMLIFSKYNIIKAWPIAMPGKTANMMVAYDILINKDTLRVVNAHLQSIRFKTEQYAFLEGNNSKSKLQKTQSIYKQMRAAYQLRAAQAQTLASTLAQSPHPTILCADLNDIPLSYVYNTVIGNQFLDAFREAGNGLQTTYKGKLPNFRIDYIIHSKNIKAINYNSTSEIPSDHKLIHAQLQLP